MLRFTNISYDRKRRSLERYFEKNLIMHLRECYSIKLKNKGTDMFDEQPINANSLK